MNPRLILGGLKSYLPLPVAKYKGTGGTVTGRYCYSVWLRHLTLIARHVPGFHPRSLVELGPGDSIGLGLAALLSGVDSYIGLDVLEHATTETNLRVLDELVELYRQRAPIPNDADFPLLHPRLEAYDFPHALVDDAVLRARLAPPYVARLREALTSPHRDDDDVRYLTPWNEGSVTPGSVDLVMTQAALQELEHTESRDDLATILAVTAAWLRSGGVMSHQVNFAFDGGTPWNEHWAHGDFTWSVIRGKRPYYVNRAPLSHYEALCEAAGCLVVGVVPVDAEGLGPDQVSPRFRTLPERDFHSSAALIIAVKR